MGPTACRLTKSRRSISHRCHEPCRPRGSRAKHGIRRLIFSSLSSASRSISPTYGASPTIVSNSSLVTLNGYHSSAIISLRIQIDSNCMYSCLHPNYNDMESFQLCQATRTEEVKSSFQISRSVIICITDVASHVFSHFERRSRQRFV